MSDRERTDPPAPDEAHELSEAMIARLAAGDPSALAECFERLGARVWRIAHGILGHAHDADDAVQEIFLRVRERARLFRGDGSFAGWVRRLAVRHCLDLRAHRGRRRARVEPAPLALLPSPERAPLDVLADHDALERALARLPDEFRVALVLRELGGLSYRELAGALGVPIGTVMSRLARARERLLGAPVAGRSEAPPPAKAAAGGTHDGIG